MLGEHAMAPRRHLLAARWNAMPLWPLVETAAPQETLRPRAWYSACISDFVQADERLILCELVANSDFDVTPEQKNAWLDEVGTLRPALAGLDGYVYLEFTIPRVGRRADAVVVVGAAIFVLEFKTSGGRGLDQVTDYCFDLKYFHSGRHSAVIVPMLVSPNAGAGADLVRGDDDVYFAVRTQGQDLGIRVRECLAGIDGVPLDASSWAAAPYRPTPTIVEAARALFAGAPRGRNCQLRGKWRELGGHLEQDRADCRVGKRERGKGDLLCNRRSGR